MEQNEFWLELLKGKDKGRSFRLLSNLVVIGRRLTSTERKKNWILLDEPSLSRIHAELRWDEEIKSYLLSHKSRAKPTLVNNKEIEEVALTHQDRIQMGDVVFRFSEGPPQGKFDAFYEEDFVDDVKPLPVEERFPAIQATGESSPQLYRDFQFPSHFERDDRQEQLEPITSRKQPEISPFKFTEGMGSDDSIKETAFKVLAGRGTEREPREKPISSDLNRKGVNQGETLIKTPRIKKYDFNLGNGKDSSENFKPINLIQQGTSKSQPQGKKAGKILGVQGDNPEVNPTIWGSALHFKTSEPSQEPDDPRKTRLMLDKKSKIKAESSSLFKPISLIQSRSVVDAQFFKETGKILGAQEKDEKEEQVLDVGSARSLQKIEKNGEDCREKAQCYKSFDLIREKHKKGISEDEGSTLTGEETYSFEREYQTVQSFESVRDEEQEVVAQYEKESVAKVTGKSPQPVKPFSFETRLELKKKGERNREKGEPPAPAKPGKPSSREQMMNDREHAGRGEEERESLPRQTKHVRPFTMGPDLRQKDHFKKTEEIPVQPEARRVEKPPVQPGVEVQIETPVQPGAQLQEMGETAPRSPGPAPSREAAVPNVRKQPALQQSEKLPVKSPPVASPGRNSGSRLKEGSFNFNEFSPFEQGKKEVLDFLSNEIPDESLSGDRSGRPLGTGLLKEDDEFKRHFFKSWSSKEDKGAATPVNEKTPDTGEFYSTEDEPPKLGKPSIPDLWEIDVVKGPADNEGKKYGIKKDIITIGKGLKNDIVIMDEQLANTHLKICFRENRFYVQKLETSQPVFINGKILITSSGKSISEGDKIQLSNKTTFIFQRKFKTSR